MLRTPDGYGRIALAMFHALKAGEGTVQAKQLPGTRPTAEGPRPPAETPPCCLAPLAGHQSAVGGDGRSVSENAGRRPRRCFYVSYLGPVLFDSPSSTCCV